MPTSRRTWRRPAKKAGGESPPEVLFVKRTHPGRRTTRALYDDAKARAAGEGEIPVLCLPDEIREGFIVCVHDEDFMYLAAEFIAQLGREELAELDSLVAAAKSRGRSGRAALLRVAGEED